MSIKTFIDCLQIHTLQLSKFINSRPSTTLKNKAYLNYVDTLNFDFITSKNRLK